MWRVSSSISRERLQHAAIYVCQPHIKKAYASIDKNEKPAVWLSTNNVWENTVAEEKLEDIDYFTPARIAINPKNLNLKSWNYHKKYSGISSAMAKSLEKIGIESGAKPYEWLVCYEEIPVENFEFIESLGVYPFLLFEKSYKDVLGFSAAKVERKKI